MPTSQHWASLQWKAEEGQEGEENSWTIRIFLQIRTTVDDERHPHHIDRAGACCSLAVLLWVAHRLVVVGLVEGVQRGVDQVDHQHRVHLSKELTYLDEQAHRRKQTLNWEQECLQKKGRWVHLLRKAFSGCFAQPLRVQHRWSRTIMFYRACVCTLNSGELWRQRGSLFNLSSTAVYRGSFSDQVIYTWTETATTGPHKITVTKKFDCTSGAPMAQMEPKPLSGLTNWWTRWNKRKTGFPQSTADTGITGWMKTSSGPLATDMKCFWSQFIRALTHSSPESVRESDPSAHTHTGDLTTASRMKKTAPKNPPFLRKAVLQQL